MLLLRVVHHSQLCGARLPRWQRDDRRGTCYRTGDAGVRLFAMIYDWPALYYKIYQEVRMFTLFMKFVPLVGILDRIVALEVD
jgi:hypothetical protein